MDSGCAAAHPLSIQSELCPIVVPLDELPVPHPVRAMLHNIAMKTSTEARHLLAAENHTHREVVWPPRSSSRRPYCRSLLVVAAEDHAHREERAVLKTKTRPVIEVRVPEALRDHAHALMRM